MRTAKIKIYKFEDLSEKARQRAKDDYAELFGYSWQDEAIASLKALAEHFGGKLKDYGFDFFNNSYSIAQFEMPDEEEMDLGTLTQKIDELGTYNPDTLNGHGDCKLTGYSSDEDAIDGLRHAFIKDGVKDLNELMQAAFKTWLKACQSDCEDFYTDIQFTEHCDVNNYEFTEDGKHYREKKK